MSSEKRHPQWWQVYVMLPLLVALFLVEMRLPFTHTEHVIAQIGIMLSIYGFIHLWLRANRRALMGIDEEQGEWQIKVYEIPPAQSPALDDGRNGNSPRPMFQFPESGLKGVLSDTFELESRENTSVLFPDHEDVSSRKE